MLCALVVFLVRPKLAQREAGLHEDQANPETQSLALTVTQRSHVLQCPGFTEVTGIESRHWNYAHRDHWGEPKRLNEHVWHSTCTPESPPRSNSRLRSFKALIARVFFCWLTCVFSTLRVLSDSSTWWNTAVWTSCAWTSTATAHPHLPAAPSATRRRSPKSSSNFPLQPPRMRTIRRRTRRSWAVSTAPTCCWSAPRLCWPWPTTTRSWRKSTCYPSSHASWSCSWPGWCGTSWDATGKRMRRPRRTCTQPQAGSEVRYRWVSATLRAAHHYYNSTIWIFYWLQVIKCKRKISISIMEEWIMIAFLHFYSLKKIASVSVIAFISRRL